MNSYGELLHDPETALPPPFTIVRLFLDDGSVEAGAWTGRAWWVRGREVAPWRWQEMRRSHPRGRCARLSAA
jgi:hypothetical protein